MRYHRADEWRPGPGVHWESWSRNGEVCMSGLDPVLPGGVRLATWLTWLLRAFASDCRLTHDATGALRFLGRASRLPSALAVTMARSSELALDDPKMIAERVRRRGRGGGAVAPVPGGGRWPALWLEALQYDYVIGRDPFPPVGTKRRRILLLAEEHRSLIPPRTGPRLPAAARKAWVRGLDVVGRVEPSWIGDPVDENERAFAVNLAALIHEWPADEVSPRPTLEVSYRRHDAVVAQLAPLAGALGLPVVWHALWRLPAGMTWTKPGGPAGMRYPAVSFVVAARALKTDAACGVPGWCAALTPAR